MDLQLYLPDLVSLSFNRLVNFSVFNKVLSKDSSPAFKICPTKVRQEVSAWNLAPVVNRSLCFRVLHLSLCSNRVKMEQIRKRQPDQFSQLVLM
jgi:hypothetical protein